MTKDQAIIYAVHSYLKEKEKHLNKLLADPCQGCIECYYIAANGLRKQDCLSRMKPFIEGQLHEVSCIFYALQELEKED